MSLNGVRKSPQSVNGCVRNSLTDVREPGATPGETLKFLRKTTPLSQEGLAAKAGIAAGYISEFECDLMIPKREHDDLIDAALLLEWADWHERMAVALRTLRARRIA